MTATIAQRYAADDFSAEAEQHRYEHGGRVLNRQKVVRRFRGTGRCLIWHVIYGDSHAATENGRCTCCGAVEVDYTAKVETFERLLDLEAEVRGAKASLLFAPIGLPDHQHAIRRQALNNAQKQLFAAVDALTPDEGEAYGRYRIDHQ
ncbi:hypothetical protein [Nocardia wallacei]|uniref:hypothetical protein n=1 Tax=Nocardia wallacei TaxID=480035 RepID=UPI0024556EB8|nr:hypothetical protein [Nocardia wallacei]